MAAIRRPGIADGIAVGARTNRSAQDMFNGQFVDITDHGAAVDGSTNDRDAIRSAMDEAVSNNAAVLFPRGVTATGTISVTSEYSGITFVGEGPRSEILCQGNAGFALRDSDGAVQNVRVANLHINANGANRGVTAPDQGHDATGNVLENLWVHDAGQVNIRVEQGDFDIIDCSVWGSGEFHGISTDPERSGVGQVRLNRILAFDNASIGIDCSGRDTVLDGFMSVNNTRGAKHTGDTESGVIKNGVLAQNSIHGYYKSGGEAGTIEMDNVVARNNGGAGIQLVRGATWEIGTIYALDNNGGGGNDPGGVEIGENATVNAEEIQSCGNDAGLHLYDSGQSGTIQTLHGSGNANGLTSGGGSITIQNQVNQSCSAPSTEDVIGAAASGGAAATGPGGGGGTGGGTTGGAGVTQFETRRVGLDDIPDNLEPPAAEVTVDAWVKPETWQALNALRDRDEPFDLAIGDFTLSDVGITDLTADISGDTSGYDVSITVKEHRITYVQAANISDTEEESEETSDDTPADEYIRDDDQFDEIPGADTESTVNLGDEGLSSGDAIDPYLDEHLASGTRVEIPYGDYTWNGGGFSGTYQNASVVGVAPDSDDGGDTTTQSLSANVFPDGGATRVYLDASNAATDGPGADITVPGGGAGSFHMAGITFTGQQQNHPLIRIRATGAGTSILLRRLFLPDGGATGSAPGIVVPSAHSGSVYVRNCYIRGFPNCGLLAGDASGTVRVEGGLYRNNNVADIELGSDDTRVELATIVNDNPAPQFNGDNRTQRGIWFSESGTGMQVVDCDFYHSVDTGSAIVAANGPEMTGTVRNTRITNDSDRPAAIINNDISFEGVHLTGAGELSIRGAQAACVGDGCNRANWSTDEEQQTVEMDERVLESGEVRRINLGDGDVLEDIVFDQSADGARVELNADGTDWTIQNIAIVGKASGQNQHATITAAAPSGSSGDIQNVYLADGAHAGSGLTGVRALAHHGGELRIQNCNVQQYPNIGVHGHRPAASDGAGGSVVIDGCYLAHNGGANATLGAPGSDLVNSVVYSDGSGPNDTSGWRGVWGWYAETTVTNSDVYTGPSAGAAIATNHGGSVTMTNGDIHGGTEGDVSLVNVGQSPSSGLPSGVPDSPVQAVGSGSSSE